MNTDNPTIENIDIQMEFEVLNNKLINYYTKIAFCWKDYTHVKAGIIALFSPCASRYQF